MNCAVGLMPMTTPEYKPTMDATELAAFLSRILAPLDACPVECDGFVRLAVEVLDAYGVPYETFMGTLRSPAEDSIPLHLWLACQGRDDVPLIIDYRARMWLGTAAPHGVNPSLPVESVEGFARSVEGYHYEGTPVGLPPITPTLFQMLAQKSLDQVLSEGR